MSRIRWEQLLVAALDLGCAVADEYGDCMADWGLKRPSALLHTLGPAVRQHAGAERSGCFSRGYKEGQVLIGGIKCPWYSYHILETAA